MAHVSTRNANFRSKSLLLERQAVENQSMILEQVIGLNARDSNGIDVNLNSGEVTYLNGCVVCIYNPKLDKQT